ncbi:GAF sensor signal transduction histidine kinase [Gloeothece citriformis PCC 7424]|uniref:histidine kinase n=1 Tax=Gloeothece citriformis (strain PCC 7424) TaxID=65393 RepID=B7KKY4_GLOC7|nr:GAF domain-containing sensor histidine kinase [Gloeothece citriformis]ACK71103.1 GAF sensor signal transduction histidine kinase [Gloeothece citriformis PCC 7424]
MSHSSTMLNPPSAEFISLCRAQLELLIEEFKADWSAVYLTREWDKSQTNLFPVVIYPEQFSKGEGLLTRLIPSGEEKSSIVGSFLQTLPEIINEAEIDPDFLDTLCQHPQEAQNNQIILPLIYQEMVMGLLVTGRQDVQWHETELTQIDKIVKTLAIACFLDQRQEWYQQQLQQQYLKNAHQRDQLDNLLHQLRNPLTALRTFGKLLLKRFLPDEKDQNVIKGIIRESDRIQDLLRQFEQQSDILPQEPSTATVITLPETETHSPLLLPSVALALEPVSVEEILTPLLISAQALAQEKQIQVISKVPPNLPPIGANFKALREVFSNLIDNAIKYTPAGGEIEVSIVFRLGDDWEGIQISDTGYGIPREDQTHIFERRYRGVQAAGNIPGTGLGLAIVKDLVEQMQGKIEFISPNGKSQKQSLPGTTFIVWFPIAKAPLDAVA